MMSKINKKLIKRTYPLGSWLASSKLATLEDAANLLRANGIYQFGPMPTSGRMIYAVKYKKTFKVQAGCFWGTLNELEKAVKEKHNCPFYLGVIELLKNL